MKYFPLKSIPNGNAIVSRSKNKPPSFASLSGPMHRVRLIRRDPLGERLERFRIDDIARSLPSTLPVLRPDA